MGGSLNHPVHCHRNGPPYKPGPFLKYNGRPHCADDNCLCLGTAQGPIGGPHEQNAYHPHAEGCQHQRKYDWKVQYFIKCITKIPPKHQKLTLRKIHDAHRPENQHHSYGYQTVYDSHGNTCHK